MFKITCCFKLLVLAGCLHLLAAGQAFCGAPLKINFQGRLDENGQPAEGSKTFVFKVYAAVSGGSPVWTSAAQALTLSDGVFSALLAAGETTALSTATFAGARFVELSVDGVTLSPRQEMASAPYALVAQALAPDADIPPAAIADGSVTNAKVQLSTAAISSGKFSDFRVLITTGAFAALNGPDQLVKLDSAGKLPAVDGSLLSNLPVAAGAVARTGDRMTGQLTLFNSTLTVTGNAFSVGETTFTVENGYVGIGTASPAEKLTVMDGNISAIQNTGAAMISVRTYDAAGYSRLFLGHAGNKIWDIGHYGAARNNNFELQHYTGAAWLTNVLAVTPAGNVGISTGMPQGRLDVLAAGSAPADQAQIWRDSAGTVVSSVSATGVHMAVKFIGDGSQLANVTAGSYSGTVAASQLTGVITDDKLGISTGAFAGGFNGPDQLVKLDDAGRLAAALPYKVLTREAGVLESYDVLSGDHTLLLDSTGGGFVINLPDASLVPGKVYVIKRTDPPTNPVNVQAFPTQKIEGEDSQEISTALMECLTIQSDGSGWSVLSWYKPS